MVGTGATASVHKATTRNHQEVAVKCIDRTKFSKTETESLLKEVEYLRMCDHTNIISFYDFFDNEPEKYYLVVEMIKVRSMNEDKRASNSSIYHAWPHRYLRCSIDCAPFFLVSVIDAHRRSFTTLFFLWID